MGARGKKRKRADGSVASGQAMGTQPRLNTEIDEPVGEVSSEAILAIMPFMVGSPPTNDIESEADTRAFDRALTDVSIKHAVDEDDLGSRGSRLGWLLDFKRPDLMSRLPDGTLQIDAKLLDFAATHDVRNRDALLEWANKEMPVPND